MKDPNAPNGAPNGPEAAETAHAIGEPGTLPRTWCKRCQAEVEPEGKGRCPRCQTFLRLNFARRKHRVNVLRRRQLLDKFVRDYRPESTYLHGLCEDLASIREKLENERPGSPEWARLVEKQQQIGQQLEASRRPATEEHADLANLTVDGLIEKTSALLDQLLKLRDNGCKGRLDATPFDTSPIVDGTFPAPPTAEPPVGDAEPTAETAAAGPVLLCRYCGDRPCVGRENHAFGVLHWNDPEERERRIVEQLRRDGFDRATWHLHDRV